MSGGAEGNPLFRHGRVRHLRIVGRGESGYVHQHRCFGRLSCVRTYFYDFLVKCRGDLCAKISISLSNDWLNLLTPSSSTWGVTLSMLIPSSGRRSNNEWVSLA